MNRGRFCAVARMELCAIRDSWIPLPSIQATKSNQEEIRERFLPAAEMTTRVLTGLGAYRLVCPSRGLGATGRWRLHLDQNLRYSTHFCCFSRSMIELSANSFGSRFGASGYSLPKFSRMSLMPSRVGEM